MAVLDLKEKGSIIETVINAIVAGYRDDLILEELAQAIEGEKITKEQFQQCADALNLYAVRFNDSVQNIGNAMKQFEFNDTRSIIKNRPLNLAQQVIKDVEGFDAASDEFHNDDGGADEVKEADIKKPAPAAATTTTPAPKAPEAPIKKEKVAPKKEEAKKAGW